MASRRITKAIRSACVKALQLSLSLLPIDKHLILMEGSSSYGDNARALFEEMIRRGLNKEYRFVWFMDKPERFRYLEKIPNVRVMGYRKPDMALKEKLSFLKLNCKAKYCFYCNKSLGERKTGGQLLLYLMHGFSLKDARKAFSNTRRLDVIFTPSPFSNPIILEHFPKSEGHLVPLGYPRDDALVRGGSTGDLLEKFKGMKKIVWMPTFKRSINNPHRNDFATDLEIDASLLSESAIQAINTTLVANNTVLFIKFHPFQDLRYVNYYSLSNIVCLTQEDLDDRNVYLYEFLHEFDALITDYSSVAFDWLILDRPIGYDLTDYDDYEKGVGLIVDNPLDYMPGSIIRSADDFSSFIRDVAAGNDPHSVERHELRSLCHPNPDGKAAERILDYIGL